MNSEIITGTERGRIRRRGGGRSRRRRKGRPLAALARALVFLCLVCAVFFGYRTFGDLYRDRYALRSRTASLLRDAAPPGALPAFASELAVVSAEENTDVSIGAESALLAQEGNGDAVFSKNAFRRMNPASTTKIMTCLVALEHIDPSSPELWTAGGEIRVSEPNTSMAGIREGDCLTPEQALYALMLPSGADAANLIAFHVAGSEEAFVSMMNRKAAEIGAVHTHFTNSHGLTDPDHYTDAYDLYLILHAAMKDERFRKIAGTAVYQAEYSDAGGKPVRKKWANTNYYLSGKAKLPPQFSVVSGKTGTTIAAGSCLALASRRGEGPLIYSIVLKSGNHDSLYKDTSAILQKVGHFD